MISKHQMRSILLFGSIVVFAIGCGGAKNVQKPAPAQQQVESELSLREAPPKFLVTAQVEIVTSEGTIVVGLFGNDAPLTVENFLRYVDSGFYENKVFHRTISGFVIQGGGFDEDLNRAETLEPIRLEIAPGLEHGPGTVSMARAPDMIHSATSQFFICLTNARQLNGSYAAFGRVESGEDVVSAIAQAPTRSVETENGSMTDVPIKPVVIESVKRL